MQLNLAEFEKSDRKTRWIIMLNITRINRFYNWHTICVVNMTNYYQLVTSS